MKRHHTKPTPAESARMAAIKQAGECMPCIVGGTQPDYPQFVEVHHLLSGGRRRGHRFTIGACRWHHQADPGWGMTKTETRAWLGPSIADGSKPFRARFGTDDALLAMQDERIGWTDQEEAA